MGYTSINADIEHDFERPEHVPIVENIKMEYELKSTVSAIMTK